MRSLHFVPLLSLHAKILAMKSFEQTIDDIAAKHGKVNGVEMADIEAKIIAALTEYEDQRNGLELASEIQKAWEDRDGWFKKYLTEVEAHKLVQAGNETLRRERDEVQRKFREMEATCAYGEALHRVGVDRLQQDIADLRFACEGFKRAAEEGREDRARLDKLEDFLKDGHPTYRGLSTSPDVPRYSLMREQSGNRPGQIVDSRGNTLRELADNLS